MKKNKSHKRTGKLDHFLPDGRQKIIGVRSFSAPPVQIGLNHTKSARNFWPLILLKHACGPDDIPGRLFEGICSLIR